MTLPDESPKNFTEIFAFIYSGQTKYTKSSLGGDLKVNPEVFDDMPNLFC